MCYSYWERFESGTHTERDLSVIFILRRRFEGWQALTLLCVVLTVADTEGDCIWYWERLEGWCVLLCWHWQRLRESGCDTETVREIRGLVCSVVLAVAETEGDWMWYWDREIRGLVQRLREIGCDTETERLEGWCRDWGRLDVILRQIRVLVQRLREIGCDTETEIRGLVQRLREIGCVF